MVWSPRWLLVYFLSFFLAVYAGFVRSCLLEDCLKIVLEVCLVLDFWFWSRPRAYHHHHHHPTTTTIIFTPKTPASSSLSVTRVNPLFRG